MKKIDPRLELESQLTESTTHLVMEKISKMIADPYRSLDNCEDVLSLMSQSDERFGMVSATPPGSPGSTLGSRTASLRSVRLSFRLDNPKLS